MNWNTDYSHLTPLCPFDTCPVCYSEALYSSHIGEPPPRVPLAPTPAPVLYFAVFSSSHLEILFKYVYALIIK